MIKFGKKIVTLCLSVTLIVPTIFSVNSAYSAANYDYTLALKNSIQFYDANKCGKDVKLDNIFDWRGPCHTTDGTDVGVDLTGGYHDAGDHVKFGLPQGYAASILAWSLYEHRSVYDKRNLTPKMLSTLKYFTDYFLKSHPDANTFYYQIGEGNDDHTYWGAPEAQKGDRPTYFVANASKPASDVLGITSAALSLMYLNYKSTDSAYAEKCLKAARELYSMGKTNLGYGNGQSFYQSNSFYDDLAWAAIWLYVIDKDEKYIPDIESYLTHPTKYSLNVFENKWTMCWDDMYQAIFLKMSELTGQDKYKAAMKYNLDYWKNTLTKTPGGLRYLSNWGVLRYAAAESMIALLYYKQTKDESLVNFAKSQVDYALGSNPASMSYLIGFGSNWSKHPHHRAANGYTYANGDNAKEAKYLLLGALVGGPDQMDKFVDDVNQFQYTEVAIDYNAGWVGVLAAICSLGETPINTPTPTSTSNQPTPTPTPSNPSSIKISGVISPDVTFASSGIDGKSGFEVSFSSANTVVYTDLEGRFTINHPVLLPAGTIIKVSKPGYLTRTIKTNGEYTSTKDYSLYGAISIWAGDMKIEGTSDNAINMADIMEIAKSFNGVKGETRYTVDKDFDKDNAINMADIMIVAKHFNATSINYPVYYFPMIPVEAN